MRRVSTGTIALVGLGLALLSLMNISGKSQAVGQSPWVLPALALIMLFCEFSLFSLFLSSILTDWLLPLVLALHHFAQGGYIASIRHH